MVPLVLFKNLLAFDLSNIGYLDIYEYILLFSIITTVDRNAFKYRVVKRNLQVVRFCDFEHMRARMAQFF